MDDINRVGKISQKSVPPKIFCEKKEERDSKGEEEIIGSFNNSTVSFKREGKILEKNSDKY